MRRMYVAGHFSGSVFIPERVTNWDGSEQYAVKAYTHSTTNWNHPRTDIWFHDLDGRLWWGRHIGWNNTVVHCEKIVRSQLMHI